MHTLQRYKEDLEKGRIDQDPEQERILHLFDELLTALTPKHSSPGPLEAIQRALFGRNRGSQPVQGIYLWGGVGRGKTYLMDLFYDCVPGERKLRTHFYRFMQEIHSKLAEQQGVSDPLVSIAAEIAKDIDVLCFDEFFISDIGDAMLMAGLLEALFAADVILVATSNVQPQLLYENGLQRERFLPAIALIERHTKVIQMADGVDYRLRKLSASELYLHPMSDQVEEQLCQHFSALAPDHQTIEENQAVPILGREIGARFCADDVVWFRFSALCDGPRSAFDYVEIARLFHAVILSEVPQLDDASNDQARRFISLIDELYDRKVKLIIGAEVAMGELYQGEQLGFEFQRTSSRLTEMQSREFLATGHLAH